MSFINITKEKLNKAFTENGDVAYNTSFSACLDYFALAGAMRFNYDKALSSFIKAFYEDKLIAIKILFYIRDIKEGLGERNLFRYTFNTLCNFYPNIAKQLLEYIPVYGRYDDLLVALNTPVEFDMVDIIRNQLEKDIENKKNGKPVSLLSKWLPSINTSSKEARLMANRLCDLLEMDKADYRKTLSMLRKGIIIENNLREKDYTFDYQKVPAGAMFKYEEAFYRNDDVRYNQYLDDVVAGKKTLKAKTLYPYQVVRNVFYRSVSDEERKMLNATWKSLKGDEVNSKTLVVRDGSGSMYDYNNPTANDVASSLTILFAERLTGEFHNKFITFSSKPQLVELKGDDIVEKCHQLEAYDDISNTDIQKVYKLILNVYKSDKFKKEDALDRIVIISDMEFDCCSDNAEISTFEYFKTEFNKIGYEMPQLVFWNVRARNTHLPVTKDEKGVILVSGSSQNVIDMVCNNEAFNPYEFMLKVLQKYSCFDKINL